MQSSRDSPSNFLTYLPPDGVSGGGAPNASNNPNILSSRGNNGNVVNDLSGGGGAYYGDAGMGPMQSHHPPNPSLLRGTMSHAAAAAAAFGNSQHLPSSHSHAVHSHHGHHMHPHGMSAPPHAGHITNSSHRPSKLVPTQQSMNLNGTLPHVPSSSYSQHHHGLQHSLQQQQQQQNHVNSMPTSNVMSSNASSANHYGSVNAGQGGSLNSGSNSPICHGLCDVWQDNLKDGIKLLRCLSLVYNYVAIDTEFPGIVAKVSHDYMDASEQAYQNIRINLNMLKPIQIGFSFMNEGGLTHEDHCTTVQFNMRWNVDGDVHAIDSIRLLENSGIDFHRLKTEGIMADEFAAELTDSGAVLNSNLKHIGYHSAYDWAYLLKLLTGWTELPDSYAEYHQMLCHYFPTILDVKVFQANLQNATKGGLQELADSYNIPRYGAQHQAGSDARLTGEVYFRIIKDERFQLKPEFDNLIFGLNYGQGTHLWVPTHQTSVNDSLDLATTSNHNMNDLLSKTSLNDINACAGPHSNSNRQSDGIGAGGAGSDNPDLDDDDEDDEEEVKNSEEEADRCYRTDENASSSSSSHHGDANGRLNGTASAAAGVAGVVGQVGLSKDKPLCTASNLSLPTYPFPVSASNFESGGDFRTVPLSKREPDEHDVERHSVA